MADQSRAGYDKILFECFLEFRKYSEYFITKSKVGKTSAKKLRLLYLLVSHNDSDNFNVARQRCVPTECCLVSICDMSIQIYSKSGNNDFQLKEYSNCCTYSTKYFKIRSTMHTCAMVVFFSSASASFVATADFVLVNSSLYEPQKKATLFHRRHNDFC